jgi:hypothetical protein
LLKFRAKEDIASSISLEASLNHSFLSDSENARLLEPPFCHNAPLFMRVSLGRVQGQVEIFRTVRHAPLATTATRTPYVIYLENRSKIRKNRSKTKMSEKHLVAKKWIQLDKSTWYMIHESRSPQGSYLDLASSFGNSDVVFLARFPRRLGRP